MKKSFDVIVLGGGISGLTLAKRLSENGKNVLIIEKDKIVGGLSQSISYKGFTLDFSAHRFHTNNKKLLTEIMKYKGLNFKIFNKVSRIYMFNKYLKYPFELQNLLRAMPFHQALKSTLSFLYNEISRRITPNKKLISYKDWFINIYGNSLYKVMCEPYTSKIWKTDPSRLSADWANQRFKTENIKLLIKRIIIKALKFDFSSYSLKDDNLAPDGGNFYYPQKGGIQALANAIKNEATNTGTQILLQSEIRKINKQKKEVIFKYNNKIYSCNYSNLVSTIPLHDLSFYLNDNFLIKLTNKLKYMDITFVYLFLEVNNVSKDHWLYFPDKDIIFNRAVEFSNWGSSMCPNGKTCICFDITHFPKTAIRKLSDDDLVNRVINDSKRANYLSNEKIIDSLVVHVDNAYPFYDLNYSKKLKEIVNYYEDSSHFLLGRTGIFRYNNSDNSIEMGFELAERMLAGKKGIFDYTIEDASL